MGGWAQKNTSYYLLAIIVKNKVEPYLQGGEIFHPKFFSLLLQL